MKLYTATGDAGMTSLVGGSRVAKHCARLEAYGTIDEFNSHLGALAAAWHRQMPDDAVTLGVIHDVQSRLFDIGASLANPDPAPGCISDEAVKAIESAIDAADGENEPLNTFILPGGVQAACVANVARTVCRRAERRVLAMAESTPVETNILRYLNRLSDYLFALGRLANTRARFPEIPWLPK